MAEMTEQHLPEEEASDELEKLEEDVKLMAEKIAEFRETLLAQLQSTLASILAAQRPVSLVRFDDDPGTSSNPNPDARIPLDSERGALVEDDPVHAEKIRTIQQKISSNASAMPLLLKRMKDCISQIDKLDSFNEAIHPAFKRNRLT